MVLNLKVTIIVQDTSMWYKGIRYPQNKNKCGIENMKNT